jgi:hypothetical protein
LSSSPDRKRSFGTLTSGERSANHGRHQRVGNILLFRVLAVGINCSLESGTSAVVGRVFGHGQVLLKLKAVDLVTIASTRRA